MKRNKNLCYRLLMMLAVMFFALDVSAQATINGHVKDETGEGVIGASVVVKGTSNGTVTDFDGNFSLKCQPGATLVFTYIGFNPQEQPAKDGMEACQGWYGDYAEGGCCPVERSRSSRLWLDGQERDFELCGSDQQGSV